MICKRCGTNAADDSVTCSVCGASLDTTANTHVASGGNGKIPFTIKEIPQGGETEQKNTAGTAQINRFCANCGQPVNSAMSFCAHCGSKVSSFDGDTDTQAPEPAKKKLKKSLLFAGIAAVLVFITGIVTFFLFRNQTPEKIAESYIEAYLKPDLKALYKLFHKDLQDYMIFEDDGYDSYNEFWEDLEETNRQTKEYYEEYFGYGYEYKYEILDTDSITGNALRELREEYDKVGLYIKEAKSVNVVVTISGNDQQKELISVTVVRIGNSWYLGKFGT